MTPIPMLQFALIGCAVMILIAVISDIATRTIPNFATLGGLVIGLGIHFSRGLQEGGIALGGVLLCSILPLLAWRRGELGGGDVKLFAAIGAFLGPVVGFDVQAVTFALGLLVLLPYRIVRHRTVKATPVILAPTIGVSFLLTVIGFGALA